MENHIESTDEYGAVRNSSLPESVLFRANASEEEFFRAAATEGLGAITIFVEGRGGTLPSIHPRTLKADIADQVPKYKEIEVLKQTKNNKLVIVTNSAEAAYQILKIQSLGNYPVSPRIQYESITSRFLLHNIPVEVTCNEIAEELNEGGIAVYEIRRFMRKSQAISYPTPTVLVTKLGTNLPSEVRLWFQNHKISQFWDRPRQCQVCYKYNHSTKSCKSEQICKRCALTHEGPCQETAP